MENDVDITAEIYRIFLLFFTWVRAHNVQIQTWRPLSCSLSYHLRRITVFSIVNSAMTPLLWLRLVLVTFKGVLVQWNLVITTSWGLNHFGRYWRASLLMGYNFEVFPASYFFFQYSRCYLFGEFFFISYTVEPH